MNESKLRPDIRYYYYGWTVRAVTTTEATEATASSRFSSIFSLEETQHSHFKTVRIIQSMLRQWDIGGIKQRSI
jgi:hypothetical protein